MAVEPAPMFDRVPPHNLDAEESVLGSMILSHPAVADAQELLKAEDFYKEAHRRIFQVLVDLYASGSTTDPVVLSEELKRRGILEAVGDKAYIYTIVETTPNPHNVKHYAEIVRDMSARRSLIDAGYDITALGYDIADDVTRVYDRAEQAIFDIGKRMHREGVTHIKDLLKQSYDRAATASEKGSSIVGVPTGFTGLDKLTAGLQPGNLVVIGGRTSSGKTSLALNIAQHASVHEGTGVLIFSMEMRKAEIVDRMVCAQARLKSENYKVGRLDQDEFERIVEASDILYGAPIYMDDTPDIKILEMRTNARQLMARENIGLIIVDYIQLMHIERVESRVQEVSTIARELKVMAGELEVPVIAASQLRRAPATVGMKAPSLEDLRESGAIEQNADIVLLLYRPESEGSTDQTWQGIAQVDLAKNRNGRTGRLRLSWVGSYMKFENLAEGEDEFFGKEL